MGSRTFIHRVLTPSLSLPTVHHSFLRSASTFGLRQIVLTTTGARNGTIRRRGFSSLLEKKSNVLRRDGPMRSFYTDEDGKEFYMDPEEAETRVLYVCKHFEKVRCVTKKERVQGGCGGGVSRFRSPKTLITDKFEPWLYPVKRQDGHERLALYQRLRFGQSRLGRTDDGD